MTLARNFNLLADLLHLHNVAKESDGGNTMPVIVELYRLGLCLEM